MGLICTIRVDRMRVQSGFSRRIKNAINSIPYHRNPVANLTSE
jgi:hypothetical protein